MLDKGFFHADPHGGNLLATPDGRLVYLDFGTLPVRDRSSWHRSQVDTLVDQTVLKGALDSSQNCLMRTAATSSPPPTAASCTSTSVSFFFLLYSRYRC